MLSDKVYNILKYVSTIFIPAVVVLISSISAAVGYDATTISAIIGAVGVFIGALIGISTKQYYKGDNTNEN